ncbi:MAG: hypothetical protein ACRELA_04270 [Candidatus Rokuibacteriota bacterium]
MAIQQELKAPSEDELDEVYDEEPRRRPWAAMANVVLALAVIFVGYQWHQTTSREQALASQAQALRAEAESLRLRAEEHLRQGAELQKRSAALATEKTALAERLATLEKSAQERVTARGSERERVSPAAKDGARERVTPVAAKKRR